MIIYHPTIKELNALIAEQKRIIAKLKPENFESLNRTLRGYEEELAEAKRRESLGLPNGVESSDW